MNTPLFRATLWVIASLAVYASLSDSVSATTDDGVTYHFDNEVSGSAEASHASGIQRIFRNPTLMSGLASGTQAINRSIESLMEAIFYSLLENELIYDLNDLTTFGITLKRDLYPTDQGPYVVVDRFSLGPRYMKNLATYAGMPLDLNMDTASNVFSIYLRSDALRLAEQEEMGFWRKSVNNWFGLLPLLTRVLPPAFNPNELYDPLAQIENPFIMPLHPDLFQTMPIGSIRSYSWSGGIRVPIDFAGWFDKDIADRVPNSRDIKSSLPFSVFVEGEQRINVLRRAEHVAWVGLSNLRRVGASVSLEVGNTFSILNRITRYWRGLPVPIYPTNIRAAIAKALKYDQLYEFDLRQESARHAYTQAVAGDFTDAHAMYLQNVELGEQTGVKFHFRRNEDGIEKTTENSMSLFAVRNSRLQALNKSEVEIIEPEGRHHLLEAKQHLEGEFWDMLVGSATQISNDQVEMKVNKVMIGEDGVDTGEYTYTFATDESNPTTINLSLRIQDRYTDAKDYENYINRIKHFTRLTLRGVPTIPLRDEAQVSLRRRIAGLENPNYQQFEINVPFTYLGSFSAVANVQLDTNALNKIIFSSDDLMWAAMAKGFGLDPAVWRNPKARRGMRYYAAWSLNTALYPLRLLNFRHPEADFVREASRTIKVLKSLRELNEPLPMLDKLTQLLNTDYPQQLTHGLLELATLKSLPRTVTFYTKARGQAPESIKRQFSSLNNRTFESVVVMPDPALSRITEEKLSAFFPTAIRERQNRPVITDIAVQARQLPDSYFQSLEHVHTAPEAVPHLEQRHLHIRVKGLRLNPDQRAKFFVRVEQGGDLQIGKLLLSEKVISAHPEPVQTVDGAASDALEYEFWLTGPLSQHSSSFYNRAINFGDEIDVTLSVSQSGTVWSDERLLRFRFANGQLTPP